MKVKNKIIQGEAKEIMESFDNNFIDLAITSPPYNKGEKQKGWLVKNIKYNKYCDNLPEDDYQKRQIEVLDEAFRIIKPGGSFFYNHKVRWVRGKMIHPLEWLLKTKWSVKQEIIWDRQIAANIRGWRFWQVDERIYWLYKPKNGNKIGKELKSKHALLSSIWRFPPERENGHPAPFPLILPARVIYSVLNGEKGVVLDPFAGSGTTCLVAKLLGSDYIGIDISEKYVEESKKRLKNYKKYKSIIEEEKARHKVEKTFSERKKEGQNTGKFKKGLFIQSKLW